MITINRARNRYRYRFIFISWVEMAERDIPDKEWAPGEQIMYNGAVHAIHGIGIKGIMIDVLQRDLNIDRRPTV